MFLLLHRLRRRRRAIGLARPERPASLALRHVDAGSCNVCEQELAATASPYYDLARHGIGVVASPRHADVLLVTGAVTTRMTGPLRAAYEAMPEPRLVAALGSCACGRSGPPASDEVVGGVAELLPVDLEIPGCPPDPEAIAAALHDALDLLRPAT